ncbi:MAG: MFS transporter [Myxococcota bacterium]|nr:MFS transporter [Myxococcota bacterium]
MHVREATGGETRLDPEPQPRGAFSYPDFRRYWFASVALVFGLQFRFIASAWLVHQITDSAFWLGVPGVVSALVTIALLVPAGALADRVDSQRLLAWGRAFTGLLNLALAIAVVTEAVTLWMVVAWAALGGLLAALTNPSQHALLPRLIHLDAMPSAVALSTSVWNGMRIIGPALAGLVIAAIGVGQALFVTAGGYAVSTYLIASLRLLPVERHAATEEDAGAMAGIRYILSNPIFFATIGLSFFSSIFGRSYVVLLPVFADDILQVGVTGFGWLEAAAGVGGLIGTLSIVRVRMGRHTGAAMVGGAVIFGLCIGAFSASRTLPLSMGFLFVAAFFASVYLNLGMTTLQLLVPDALRGRVMGVWGLTWFLAPAGGFVAASLAAWFGAPTAVAVGALAVSGFGLLLYLTSSELRAIPPREEMTPSG